MTTTAHPCEHRFETRYAEFNGFVVKASVCVQCGETHHDPAGIQLILAYMKHRDKPTRARVTTTGGSMALRIDRRLAEEFGLQPGDDVQVEVTGPGEWRLVLRENPPRRVVHVVHAEGRTST
jgi:antitoxin component of MazEF toxin-antitoxin module